jgi:hypothetical protein
MSMPTEKPMANSYVNRFFGGPPLSVIFRLILLSILIGVILEMLGLDPWNILDSLRRLVLRVWDMGFDAVALAVALSAPRCGGRGADLAGAAAPAPGRRQVIQVRRPVLSASPLQPITVANATCL